MKFSYHPYYCEENIWHLCQHPSLADVERHVMFLSNRAGAFAIHHQRAAPDGELVFWDYHVICAVKPHGAQQWFIYDLDSRLCAQGDPLAAKQYLTESFTASTVLPPALLPRFRVIEGSVYAKTLVSNRSHMRDATGEYLKPPPNWAPIGAQTPGLATNLIRFLVTEEGFVGEILDLKEVLHRYAGPPPPPQGKINP